jgi:integrase
MLSLRDRFELLEADLLAEPPRFIMSRDLPFAIFRYDPSSPNENEWMVRKDIDLLATRVLKLSLVFSLLPSHALNSDEEAALLSACLMSRSRCLYPAVMVALNTGMRYNEIRLLQWKQLDFVDHFLTVGKSKTRNGTGRVIPLNARIFSVLELWAMNFPQRQPNHYVFPFERYGASGEEDTFGFTAGAVAYDTDPTRPIGDWKEAWEKAKERAGAILRGEPDEPQPVKIEQLRKETKGRAKPGKGVNRKEKNTKPASLKCRFHDLRHSAVTRLLEAGIPYPVVASVMGWSAATAIRMSKRYGHIGQKALRDAMDVLCSGEIGAGSLKKSPKLQEHQNIQVQ